MKKKASIILLAALLGGGNTACADWSDRDDVGFHVQEIAKRQGLDPAEVKAILAKAEFQPEILAAISRPAEAKPWNQYRDIFLVGDRAERGAEFWKRNEATLAKAQREFGVPAQVILAILGVETKYGTHQGSYRVIDALATLGFDYPKRGEFFRAELGHYLRLAQDENFDPFSILGSYAGAMGQAQFMPSSYRNYAVDFDGDGKRDLWKSVPDAVGSIANYLRRHGWQQDQPVALRVTARGETYRELLDRGFEAHYTAGDLAAAGIEVPAEFPADAKAAVYEMDGEQGPELWLGLTNFYVITRYNRSALYALAVYQLSEQIKAQRGVDAAAAP